MFKADQYNDSRPHKVVNMGTESPVSHTESGEVMLWPDRRTAARHAYNLTVEYKLTRPELDVRFRSWVPVRATADEIMKAKAAGAFGIEYEDIIGTGQARPDSRGVRNPETGDGDVEKFRDALDRHGFKKRNEQ